MGTEQRLVTHFSFDEIYQDLCRNKSIDVQRFTTLPLNVMSYKKSSFSLVNDDMMIAYIDSIGFRSYESIVHGGDYVCLVFTHSGSRLIESRDQISESICGELFFMAGVSPLRMMFPAKSYEKCISLKVLPQVLMDRYGLNIDVMPQHLRLALLGVSRAPVVVRINLSPRCRVALNSIFSCQMESPLFLRYLHAKAEELTCESVYELNKSYAGGFTNFGLSKSEKDMQIIEAAAHIYDQSIGHAPSIDTLSHNLGIDRNKLTAGFKDRYGCPPAEYGRTRTLEWAKSQLIEASHSIQSVAATCGYSSTSAFTRAFAAHFGRTPSSLRRERAE